MRALRELSRIMLGLVIGAALFEALFVRTGLARLGVLLVAGALVVLSLWVLRELRRTDDR